MSRRIHVCLDVRGVLHLNNRDLQRDFAGRVKNAAGETLTDAHDIRNAFMDELVKGNEYIPCGPCDNFDPKKGCMGHDIAADGAA